ncbi:carboxypeptidase-like regulatory domain-containing protein [Mucilaginibacter dorajii]|uniref:Carboxypeptidase-like regulatory domain-containing protein n=1 Tax=Mucilaginibacter dorajii TaxID=692994 RepID=A0ABP7PAR0_9SPHI
MANASVFLNNAIVGDKTADDGTFTLRNVKPGQYTFIVTAVGFETHSITLMAGTANIALPEISLAPKTIMLQEVNIKPDPNRQRNYDDFKRLFLGTSANAAQCKILNPDVVDVDFDSKKMVLSASSRDDFIEVENKALGYLIKYKLTAFSYDAKHMFYYEGVSVFQELKGSKGQQRKWQKNRMVAYLGSSMHFLRSVISGQTDKDGFEVLRLVRKPNPNYKEGRMGANNYKYNQSLYTKPALTPADFSHPTDQPGLFAIGFTDCLYVIFKNKRVETDLSVYHPIEVPNYPVTILAFDELYAFFDHNGIITNPHSVIFEGDWGASRVAEMLPVDYEPEKANGK